MLDSHRLLDDSGAASGPPGPLQADIDTIIASGLFRLDLYQRQVGRPLDLADAVRDYVVAGERSGRQPHPLFLPSHAVAQLAGRGAGSGRAESVFATYLRRADGDVDPHPLFDAARFRRMSGSSGRCALVAYEEQVRAGPCPSPCVLFDRAHYGASGEEPDGLQHYLSQGWRDGRSPHPLFDAARWRAAAARRGVALPRQVNPLLIYWSDPSTWQLPTCTLFEPEVFAAQLAERDLKPGSDRPPLADLLDRAEILSGHRMFDPDFYLAQAQALGIEMSEHPLLHHARRNGRAGIDPHPMFSVRFYLQSYQDVARSAMDPLQHFIRHGCPELRNPNPLMLSKPYAQQVSRSSDRSCDDVVRHYMEEGGSSLTDPHPLFEAALYAARRPECLAPGDTPLTHYVRGWRSRGVEFPPWGTTLAERRGRGAEARRVDLILVSHELTRTGAPLILLALVREFVSRLGLGCLVIAVRGGELRDAFLEWAPVIDLAAVKQAGCALDEFVASLATSLGGQGGQRAVLINTACVAELGASFAATGLPVVTLVHELPAAFTEATFERIYRASRLVVYPAAFVRSEVHRSFQLDIGRTEVIPQGLLDDAFGTGDADLARDVVLRELGAPPQAFVVLGCGTRDLRKGIDLFAGVASGAIGRQAAGEEPARPLYFLWLGGGEGLPQSPFWHVERDLEASGLAARVRFIGARSRSEPFFLGCDAFALTSRLDPFPCVVHEAMASGKPVVVFDRAGGAPEALAGGGGAVVPYGDVAAMAATVAAWADDATGAAALGARAEAIVRSRYRFPAYADRILEEVSRVGGPQRAAPASRAPAARHRIVVALPELSDEAAAWTTADLVRGLIGRGLDAELLYTGARPPTSPAPFLADLPLRVLARTFRQPPTYADAWADLRLALEATTPAVLAAGSDDVAGALAPALPLGVSALGSIADDHPSTAERVVRLGRYWHRAVAATPELRAWAIGLSPLLDGRCVVIPPATRSGGAPPASSLPLRVVCASGRLGSKLPIRFAEDLVECLAAVPATLTVVGLDPQVAMLSPVLAPLAETGRLVLLPPVGGPALDQALQGCHALVVPGAPFTRDLSAPLQAMAAGLAVIRFGGGGEKDWLDHEETGLAVAPGDRRGLARAAAGLAADLPRLERLRERAHAYARSRTTDLETSCDLHAALLREMLEELREGSFVAPAPPLLHPHLGALSLAPSQVAHPDRAPPTARRP